MPTYSTVLKSSWEVISWIVWRISVAATKYIMLGTETQIWWEAHQLVKGITPMGDVGYCSMHNWGLEGSQMIVFKCSPSDKKCQRQWSTGSECRSQRLLASVIFECLWSTSGSSGGSTRSQLCFGKQAAVVWTEVREENVARQAGPLYCRWNAWPLIRFSPRSPCMVSDEDFRLGCYPCWCVENGLYRYKNRKGSSRCSGFFIQWDSLLFEFARA